LVLLRGEGRQASVLVGRRASTARFLPGIYAFPGGGLERGDFGPCGFDELPPLAIEAGLDQKTRRSILAFARAALRETFEETGLLIGTSGPTLPSKASSATPWVQYRAAGLIPAFEAMKLVARAITPTRSHRRYHTRFFTADGSLAKGHIIGNGELEDLAWVPLSEALSLPMAQVGTLVLREALAHRASASERPAALFRWRGPEMRPAYPRLPT
jgi:8-oxo-dGTP pyrophosphatase MutT (NUDIX family)